MKDASEMLEKKEKKLPTESKKILLADDDSAMRKYLEVILKKNGYEILSAEDGLAAMNLALSDEKIDAFVLDAMMPNFTGYDLCRILRQNPSHAEKPMIILSGLEMTEKPSEGAADFYLVKSADLKTELKTVLSALLNKVQ